MTGYVGILVKKKTGYKKVSEFGSGTRSKVRGLGTLPKKISQKRQFLTRFLK